MDDRFVVGDDAERAVLARADLDHSRTLAVEVAQHPFAVLEGTAVGAGIPIDAQNRRGNFRSFLLDDEAERLLALR